MAALFAPTPFLCDEQNRSYYRHALLHLDCSSDLRQYSRNLGPHVPNNQDFPTINGNGLQKPIFGAKAANFSNLNALRTPSTQLPSTSNMPPRSYSPVREESPHPDELSTYPRLLHAALERSSQLDKIATSSDTIYTIIEHVDSNYMADSTDILGNYRSMHSANLAASKHFVAEYGGSGFEEECEFMLKEDGSLRLVIETDGSMGGRVTVYVQRSKLS